MSLSTGKSIFTEVRTILTGYGPSNVTTQLTEFFFVTGIYIFCWTNSYDLQTLEMSKPQQHLVFSGKAEDFSWWREKFLAYLTTKDLDDVLEGLVELPAECEFPGL